MLVDTLIILATLLGVAFILATPQGHRPFTFLMLLYALVLSGATALSLADSRTIADWATPYLADSDGARYFEEASLLAQVGLSAFQSLTVNYAGYQLLLGFLFSIFGPSLLVALVANNVLLLLSILCLYRATLLLTASPRAATLACLALMLTSQAIYYSLTLMKEPALCLAFALILLSIVKATIEKNIGIAAALYFLLALLIILSMRTSLIAFLFVLVAFVGTLLIKRRGHLVAVFLGVMLLALPFAQQFTAYELDVGFFTETIASNEVVESRFAEGDLDLGGFTGRVIGIYLGFPFPVKVILFPVPTVVQVFLPFNFWSIKFLDDHFVYLFGENLNPIWYLFLVVWIGFAIFNLKRGGHPLMGRLLLAGAFYYVVVAVIYGGLIPRYVIPALIFMYPAVGYWWSRSREDPEVRVRVRQFFGHYYAFAGLAVFGFLGFQLSRWI